MSIPLFAFDANPQIDRPICSKSRAEVVEMLREGSVFVLRNKKGKEFGVQSNR